MNKSLALYFTFATSLESWEKDGILFREKLLYESHLEQQDLSQVFWITYGEKDFEIAERLKATSLLHPKIEILAKPKIFNQIPLGNLLYSLLIPLLFSKTLSMVEIHKSNQMAGAWSACLSAFFHRSKFYLRTGYTYTKFLSAQKRYAKYYLYYLIENFLYRLADFSAVSSIEDSEYLEKMYGVRPHILRNYIDRNKFKDQKRERKNEFLFVGRLNSQKNLVFTLNLCAKLKLPLTLIGDGELKKELSSLAESLDFPVSFLGKISNDEIADKLNQYKYFIQLSHFEGMPKTLIEACASGCVCIASLVPGSKEVVIPKSTGYILDHQNIMHACQELRDILQQNHNQILTQAQIFIEENFSLDSIRNRESEFFS